MPQDPGNPGPQYFDMQWDPENPGPQNFDSRKTLETQDLKIWKCGETLETQDPEPQNFDVSGLKDLGPYTIQYRISCWALCQEVQQVMNSDDRTPKTWILKKIIQLTGPTLPVVGCRW